MTLRSDRSRGGLRLVVEDGPRPPGPARDHRGLAKQPDGSYRVRVSVGPRGWTRTAHKRFPPNTSVRLMRDWQTGARARLLASLPAAAVSGTLAADVSTYLASVPEAARANLGVLLGHWTAVYKRRPTLSLTRQEVARTLDGWRTTRAASTINHRLTALAGLFRRLYPDHDPPTRGLRRYREPPVSVPVWTLAEVRAVLEHCGARTVAKDVTAPSRAAAHLRVFAETGIPPVRIARVRPEHLALDAQPPTVYLEPRRKGRGTPGRVYPLSAAAVAAWRGFVAAHAWGPIAPETLGLVWRRACAKAGRRPCRVYDLRHIIGAEMYRRTGDVYAVAELLDVTVPTALRYTRGAVGDAASKVIAALNAPAASGQSSGQSQK